MPCWSCSWIIPSYSLYSSFRSNFWTSCLNPGLLPVWLVGTEGWFSFYGNFILCHLAGFPWSCSEFPVDRHFLWASARPRTSRGENPSKLIASVRYDFGHLRSRSVFSATGCPGFPTHCVVLVLSCTHLRLRLGVWESEVWYICLRSWHRLLRWLMNFR